jgi:hypothetical protein
MEDTVHSLLDFSATFLRSIGVKTLLQSFTSPSISGIICFRNSFLVLLRAFIFLWIYVNKGMRTSSRTYFSFHLKSQ